MTPPRFDWIAPYYACAESITFGGLLQWCRTALLPELANARRVLILGEGNGRFAATLIASNPLAVVDVVDASPAMVALARRRVAPVPGAARRIRWHVADVRRSALPSGPYDLIVTNFFLDCFPARELARLIPRIAAGLAADGRWLVGDFALPPSRIWRAVAHVILTAMYAFFAIVTRIPAAWLVDPAPALRSAGLEIERETRRLGGFLVARIWRRAAAQTTDP